MTLEGHGQSSGIRMRTTISRAGFLCSLIAFVGVIGYDLSVPLQVYNLVTPLQDATIGYASSLIIATPFLLAMLALHHTVSEDKKFWTNAAVMLGVIYTAFCSINYIVQLTTVIPAGYSWTLSNQQGTQGSLSLLNQTPHSLFWDLDASGYLFMGLATLFAFPVFGKRGLEKWLRRFFLANALATPPIAIVYFYPVFSANLLILGLPQWIITIPTSLLLLAVFFLRKKRQGEGNRFEQLGFNIGRALVSSPEAQKDQAMRENVG